MKKRAFTLMEVLIVVVIISILFIALVSRVDFSVTESREMTAKTDFLSYQLAIEQVALEEKELTTDLDKLRDQLNVHLDYELLLETTDGYLTTNKEDPWGQKYKIEYSRAGDNLGKVTIKSAGPDMLFDSDDDLETSVTYLNTPYGYKVIKD